MFCQKAGVLVILSLTILISGNTLYAKQPQRDLSKLYFYYLKAQVDAGEGNVEGAIENYKKAITVDPQSAQLMSELSFMLMQAQKFKDARIWAEKALQVKDSADAHLLLARIYTSMGQKDLAVKEYGCVIKMKPDDHASYLLLSSLYIKDKKYEAAAAILEDLIQKDKSSFMGYYYLGKIYSELKPVEAEQYYLKAIELNPRFEPALVELAAYYEDIGNKTKLISTFERIISFDPENPEILIGLGGSYLKEGRTADAVKQFEKAKTITKENSSVLTKIGMIWLAGSNYDEAIKEFESVLANDPEDDKARLYLGMAYAEKGDLEKALLEYRKVTRQSPAYTDARVQASNILRRQNKTGEAIDILKELCSLQSDRPEPFIALAQTYEDADLLDETEAVLTEGIRRFPGNLDFQFQMGVLLDKRGEKQKSIDKMKEILAADPNHTYALNYLGYMYADMGTDLDEAEELIKRAIKAKPGDGYILDSLGWVYYQKGKYEEAVQELEKALALIPGGDPVLYEHLGDAYGKLKVFSKALENYLKTESAFVKKQDRDRISAKIEEVMSALSKEKPSGNAESRQK